MTFGQDYSGFLLHSIFWRPLFYFGAKSLKMTEKTPKTETTRTLAQGHKQDGKGCNKEIHGRAGDLCSSFTLAASSAAVFSFLFFFQLY